MHRHQPTPSSSGSDSTLNGCSPTGRHASSSNTIMLTGGIGSLCNTSSTRPPAARICRSPSSGSHTDSIVPGTSRRHHKSPISSVGPRYTTSELAIRTGLTSHRPQHSQHQPSPAHADTQAHPPPAAHTTRRAPDSHHLQWQHPAPSPPKPHSKRQQPPPPPSYAPQAPTSTYRPTHPAQPHLHSPTPGQCAPAHAHSNHPTPSTPPHSPQHTPHQPPRTTTSRCHSRNRTNFRRRRPVQCSPPDGSPATRNPGFASNKNSIAAARSAVSLDSRALTLSPSG
jgi:hypothetical protein